MPEPSSRLVTDASGLDPKVYYVKSKRKQWVTNEDCLKNLGFTWDDIQKIDDTELASYPADIPLTSPIQKIYDTKDYIYCIEKSWSDNFHIGIIGWAVGKHKPLKSLTISAGGKDRKVTDWKERPEIYEHFKAASHSHYPVQLACGFSLVILRQKPQEFTFTPGSSAQASKLTYQQAHFEHAGIPLDKKIEQRFRDIVNNNKLDVLEVGSRVSPGGVNKRNFFKQAGSYTGFDYHPGELVDVVGDAHKLSTYFDTPFDAVYSDSVLEHLAAPWKAVIEINKVLKKGGYVYHSAPSTWGLHDMPWDFWRFSDAGLKSLFSEAFGFEVIDVEYTAPVSIHADFDLDDSFALMPVSPAYGFVGILAKKVKNIDPFRVRFAQPLKKHIDKDTEYPLWDK